MSEKIPLLIILGPTATGKSDLAVTLAQWIEKEKIGGYEGAEIISADSRQVYKGLDIGTGKITPEEMQGVPHYCLDIADPQERFSVSDWKMCAEKAIAEIRANKSTGRGKLPIICGGTGFYIDALVDDLEFQTVNIDPKIQAELEQKSVEDLFAELETLDPNRAKAMNNGSDNKNKRRLIRSIFIAQELGVVPPLKSKATTKYDPIFIGLSVTDEDLKKRIKVRLAKRLDTGMIDEAKKLNLSAPTGSGISFERMEELGLEYRYLAKYLQGQLTGDQLVETLGTKIWQFAKRQKTWFKRNEKIKWFEPTEIDQIKMEIKTGLKHG